MDIFPVKKNEKIFMQTILLVAAIFWLIPVYSAVERSLLGDGFKNYIFVLTESIGGISIYMTFVNSAIIAVGKTVIIVLLATTAAFSFSKMDFFGKETIYIIVVSLLAVPITAIIVPLFFMVNKLHLYNTHMTVILIEAVFEIPFSILMCRNYFDSLPIELMESSQIDGANYFQIFTKIYLPLAKSAVITLVVLSIMYSLKDYIIPMIYAPKAEITTATLAVTRFKDSLLSTPVEYGRYCAALVIICIPITVVFSALQGLVRKGLIAGAVKG